MTDLVTEKILDNAQDTDGDDDRYAVLRPLLYALAQVEIRREIAVKESDAAPERMSMPFRLGHGPAIAGRTPQ